jgi:hypothetical protein
VGSIFIFSGELAILGLVRQQIIVIKFAFVAQVLATVIGFKNKVKINQ